MQAQEAVLWLTMLLAPHSDPVAQLLLWQGEGTGAGNDLACCGGCWCWGRQSKG